MSELRFKVLRRLHPFVPQTMLARVTAYFVGIWAVLAAVSALAASAAVNGLATLCASLSTLVLVAAVGCLAVLAFRWFVQRFLWRLRNRLMVSYVLIGVVPVLLIVFLAALGFLLFAVQYATSQALSQVEVEARSLDFLNTAVLQQYQATRLPAIPERFAGSAEAQQRFPQLTVAIYRGGHRIAGPSSAPPELPAWLKPPFRGIVRQGNDLYLRSVIPGSADAQLVAYSSAPISKALLDRLFKDFGIVRFSSLERVKTATPAVGASASAKSSESSAGKIKLHEKSSATGAEEEREYSLKGTLLAEGGSLPQSSMRWDADHGVGTFAEIRNWQDGEPTFLLLYVRARLSTIYMRLFISRGEMATGAIIGMVAISVIFAIIEIIALLFGLGLSRTITQSIANLYEATQHINRGDMAHRIRIKRKDQLAALQSAFNSMAGNLEKLIEEQKEKQRLESEIAIAQEVQSMLFPHALPKMQSLEVHGVCKPARSVSGDYYDFIPCGEEQMAIAVGDISGKGISAALLMATIHSAVRVYELGGVPRREEAALLAASGSGAHSSAATTVVPGGLQSPAVVLELLNRHLYNSTPTEKYATLFLGVFDGATRQLTYSNAGHLPPMVMAQAGAVRRLEVSGTVIGLFDNMPYQEHSVRLAPGDLFVAFSDGVTEPENDFGEFGEERLLDVLRQFRGEPLERISEEVLRAVADWIGAAEQPDDVTLVLARAL